MYIYKSHETCIHTYTPCIDTLIYLYAHKCTLNYNAHTCTEHTASRCTAIRHAGKTHIPCDTNTPTYINDKQISWSWVKERYSTTTSQVCNEFG